MGRRCFAGQSQRGGASKRLQLLADLLPGASHFGAVWTPSFAANHFYLREMQAAAVTLRVSLDSHELTQPGDIDDVFKRAAAGSDGLVVLSGPLIFRYREEIVAAAARNRVAAVYYDAEYAEAGGLMSYGPSLIDLHRSAAVFVDKILKGAKAAELPVEQPTRFKLVVNMKSAKDVGLTIPPTLLARADEVIE
jgi:putative ABC transport system substrate-binding protein